MSPLRRSGRRHLRGVLELQHGKEWGELRGVSRHRPRHLDPRIDGLDIRERVVNGHALVIIRVPLSPAVPHMVTFQRGTGQDDCGPYRVLHARSYSGREKSRDAEALDRGAFRVGGGIRKLASDSGGGSKPDRDDAFEFGNLGIQKRRQAGRTPNASRLSGNTAKRLECVELAPAFHKTS